MTSLTQAPAAGGASSSASGMMSDGALRDLLMAQPSSFSVGSRSSAGSKRRKWNRKGSKSVVSSSRKSGGGASSAVSANGSRDRHISAVASALVESVVERRKESGGEAASIPVSSSELFLSCLTALGGTLEGSNSGGSTSNEAQFSLLEILRRVSVSAATSSSRVFLSQLDLVAQYLRILTMATTASAVSAEDDDDVGVSKVNATSSWCGPSALLRQTCRTAGAVLQGTVQAVLQLASTHVDDEDDKDDTPLATRYKRERTLTKRILFDCVLCLLDDKRPKIRREAHAVALEVVEKTITSPEEGDEEEEELTHMSSADERDGDGNDADVKMEKEPTSENYMSWITEELMEYLRTNLFQSNKSNTKKTQQKSRSPIYLLSFVERAIPLMYGPGNKQEITTLCEDLIHLSLAVLNGATSSNEADLDPTFLANASLSALASAFEATEDANYDTQQNAQIDQMTSRVLASLLQSSAAVMTMSVVGGARLQTAHNISNDVDNDVEMMDRVQAGKPTALVSLVLTSGSDLRITYGRCLALACARLLRTDHSSNDEYKMPPQTATIAIKLLPLSITTLVTLSDFGLASGGTANSSSAEVARRCAMEVTRLLRSGLLVPLSLANRADDEDANKEEAAMAAVESGNKCLQDCAAALEKVFEPRYSSHWTCMLPVVSTFVTVLLANGDEDATDEIFSRRLERLSGVIQPLIEGLVQLRAECDGPSLSSANSGAGDSAQNPKGRAAAEAAVGTIIASVGVEEFWTLVPIGNDVREPTLAMAGGSGLKIPVRMDRAWILPLLKSSLSACTGGRRRPRLDFFRSVVLPLARKCDAATAVVIGSHTASGPSAAALESAQMRMRVLELWSLFPCFCRRPSDAGSAFLGLGPTLIRALGDERYPELVPVICTGLNTLASGILEGSNPEEDGKEASEDNKEIEVTREASVKILPSLFRMIETLHGASSRAAKGPDAMDEDDETTVATKARGPSQQDAQKIQLVTETIGSWARLTPRPFLQGLFKKVVQRLLSAAQSDDDEFEKICSLLGLSQALVMSRALDEDSVSLLYRANRPLMRSDEHDGRCQKRAYKLMAEICSCYPSFVVSPPERLEEVSDLLIGSVVTCQVSSRHMRLKCMNHIAEALDRSNDRHMELLPRFVSEVLLCLKDSNGKTREMAYQLLLSLSEVRNDMKVYFHIVVAGLGAQTPHMRSAAVMALSRLVFEYARENEEVQEMLPFLLETVIVLFDEKSREVIKSVVGFVRVSVAALNAQRLEPLLPQVVGGLFKYNKGKDRFRSKIKIILKKLVRMYGYEKITPLVPEGDARLLTHMRKLAERESRRKANSVESDGRDAGEFDDMMESDEEDSDDGRTLMTGITGFTRKTARGAASRDDDMSRSAAGSRMTKSVKSVGNESRKSGRGKDGRGDGPRLVAEKGGEVYDILDPGMARNVHFGDGKGSGPSEYSDDDMDEDDGVMEFDAKGRLVVRDPVASEFTGGNQGDDNEDDADDAEENADLRLGKKQRVSKFEAAKVAKAERDAFRGSRKRRNAKDAVKPLGSAYKAKKGTGGDVKRKDQKFEPYAYVPLDGRSYTKNNRRKAVAEMSTVVGVGKDRKRKRK